MCPGHSLVHMQSSGYHSIELLAISFRLLDPSLSYSIFHWYFVYVWQVAEGNGMFNADWAARNATWCSAVHPISLSSRWFASALRKLCSHISCALLPRFMDWWPSTVCWSQNCHIVWYDDYLFINWFIKCHKVVTSEVPFLFREGRNHLRYSFHLPTEWWPSWVAWINIGMVDLPKVVTNPSTNWARCNLTLLIWQTPLPLCQTSHFWQNYDVVCISHFIHVVSGAVEKVCLVPGWVS